MRYIILLWFYFFAFAFDFKGEAGGNVFVYLMTAFGFLCALFFLIENLRFSRLPKAIKNVFYLLVTPVVICLIPMFFGDLEFDSFVRAIVPYLFVLLSYLIVVSCPLDKFDVIFKPLLFASIVSLYFTIAYGISGASGGVEDVRYKIISPYVLGCLAVLYGRYFAGLSYFKYASLVAPGVFFVALFSLTRSFLAAVVFSFLLPNIMFGVIYKNTARPRIMPWYVVLVVLLVVALAVAVFFPSAVSGWIERTYYSTEYFGFDLTSKTRRAEIKSQIDLLFINYFNILFGNGIGGRYDWNELAIYELSSFLERSALEADKFFVGHNFWVYSIFASGLVFGLIYPGVVFYCLFLLHRFFSRNSSRVGLIFACSSLVYFVFFMFFTVGGNPLGTRTGGLLFGFFVGLVVLVNSRFEEKKSRY